jgi:hypothetical protein
MTCATIADATVEVDAPAFFKHHVVHVDAPNNLFIIPRELDFVVSAPTSNKHSRTKKREKEQ